MTFIDFCEKMLIALYQDGHQSNDWLSFADLQTRYGLEAYASWLSRAMNHLSAQRRIEGREINGAPDSVVGRITGSGMAYIEGKYGSKDGVGQILSPVLPPSAEPAFLTTESGDYLTTQSGDYISVETPAVEQAGTAPTFSSSAWTGLPTGYELTEARRHALSKAIAMAEGDLDALGASNAEKAQARAYIVAIRALADAPEPPADLIWALLNRVATIATIASLFVPLIQAFAH